MRMRRRAGNFAIAAMAFEGLIALAACGGGSNAPPPPPPPPTNNTGAVTVYPGTASIPVGQQVRFTAFLASAPTATFSWSLSGMANGTIDSATGVYTAPATIPNPASVTITATAAGGANQTGTATINIAAAQGLVVGTEILANGMPVPNQVGPSVVVLPAGTVQKFNSTAGGLHQMPNWEVNGSAGGDPVHGTITADPVTGDGVYSAPLTPPPGGSTVITARSGALSGTASVTVVFSTRSFGGQYAFSYAGSDASGPLAAAGSFTANGATGMLSGLEDYNSKSLHAPAQAVQIAGPFSVNPDGSATATVTPTGMNPPFTAAATWRFTLIASSQGGVAPHALMVRFDSAATGSGAIDQQNPTRLLLSAVSGNYAFGLSGVDANRKTLQIAGRFDADGFGTIPVNKAVEDINDGGTNTQSAPDKTLHGTYAMDAMFPGTGRGTVQLINTSTQLPGTFDFAFYIVDGAHLKVVETDTNAFLAGDFFSAPNPNGSFTNSIFNGTYAFTLGGTDVSNKVPFAEGGIIVANGSGSVTSGVLDVNDGGLSVNLNTALSGSNYSVDSGLGRIALSLSNSNTTVNFAAYTTSSGSVLVVRLDPAILAAGTGLLQTSTAAVQGSFAADVSGALNSHNFPEEDLAGQVTASGGTRAPAGNLNLNNAGTLVTAAALTNTSTINNAASNGRGTAAFATSSTAFPLAYYIVDSNTVLVIGSDATRITAGALVRQF
jgi:hypothetical protein